MYNNINIDKNVYNETVYIIDIVMKIHNTVVLSKLFDNTLSITLTISYVLYDSKILENTIIIIDIVFIIIHYLTIILMGFTIPNILIHINIKFNIPTGLNKIYNECVHINTVRTLNKLSLITKYLLTLFV